MFLHWCSVHCCRPCSPTNSLHTVHCSGIPFLLMPDGPVHSFLSYYYLESLLLMPACLPVPGLPCSHCSVPWRCRPRPACSPLPVLLCLPVMFTLLGPVGLWNSIPHVFPLHSFMTILLIFCYSVPPTLCPTHLTPWAVHLTCTFFPCCSDVPRVMYSYHVLHSFIPLLRVDLHSYVHFLTFIHI
jgi:hypothetical protein